MHATPRQAAGQYVTLALLFLALGCTEAPPPVEVAEARAQFVTVKSSDGKEELIPSYELAEAPAEEQQGRQVLALDRTNGQETWISVADLIRQPPSTGRYRPVLK